MHTSDSASVDDLVPVGAARLSQLCKEDKAKVAKLIAQVTQLRHENDSFNASSMSLNASSESAALAQGEQEKLEHEVQMAQKKLETLQTDNKRLLDEAELVRDKYGRSLEMLKQYQDRLVSLSEEKESLSNISRVMQASEADAETRMIELESQVATLHDSLAQQKAIVESHVDIENKQEKHVRDLENKLSKALKKAARVAAASAASEAKKKAPNSNLSATGATATGATAPATIATASATGSTQSLKRPRSPPSSAHTAHHTTLPAPTPSAEANIPDTFRSAGVAGGGDAIGVAVGGSVSATSVSAEQPPDSGAAPIPPHSSRVAHLQQQQQQDGSSEFTPRTQARKRLTAVTQEVVREIESELEKAHAAAAGIKMRVSHTGGVSASMSSIKKKKKKGKRHNPQSKSFDGPPPALITSTTPGPGFRPPTFPAPPVVNSTRGLGKAYGINPYAKPKTAARPLDERTWQRLSGGNISALPLLSKAVSPDRGQFLKQSGGGGSGGGSSTLDNNRNGARNRNRDGSSDEEVKASSRYSRQSSPRRMSGDRPAGGGGAGITESTREDLLGELKRAHAALAELRIEQTRTNNIGIHAAGDDAEDMDDLVNLGEVGDSLDRGPGPAVPRRRKKKRKKKKPKPSSRSQTGFSPQQLSPQGLSETIHYYDDSLVDLIDSVEHDESLHNMSMLSSIGYEDDDIEAISTNASSEFGDLRDDSPRRLYIAAARRPRGTRRVRKGSNSFAQKGGGGGGGRRSRRGAHGAGAADVDPDIWWESVGRYLNRKGGQKSRSRKVKVMRAGGRRGDYWGMFSSPSRTPRSFAQRFDRNVDDETSAGEEEIGDFNQGEEDDFGEEFYEDDAFASGQSESKGEPVYHY